MIYQMVVLFNFATIYLRRQSQKIQTKYWKHLVLEINFILDISKRSDHERVLLKYII